MMMNSDDEFISSFFHLLVPSRDFFKIFSKILNKFLLGTTCIVIEPNLNRTHIELLGISFYIY